MKSKKTWLQKNLEFLESEEFKKQKAVQQRKLESYACEILDPVIEPKEFKEAMEKEFKRMILIGDVEPQNNEIYSNGSIKAKFTKL